MTSGTASYVALYESGELARRIDDAHRLMRPCRLCPRACGVDRWSNEKGICRTGRRARVASYGPHFGEEAPLVGCSGSGTIFFSSCNLLCSFCQNSDISHLNRGEIVHSRELARIMLSLQERGCHNINLVTPTHVIPQIMEAVLQAAEAGLTIPLVYNSGGYDSVDSLMLLEGIVDIYLPDFKFWDTRWAERYCRAPDYRETAQAAISEMYRQVGDLVTDTRGIAIRGLMVRHLVMPEEIAGTHETMTFIARHISKTTYVNIMSQYHPCAGAVGDTVIGRRITRSEFDSALTAARTAGLTRMDEQ